MPGHDLCMFHSAVADEHFPAAKLNHGIDGCPSHTTGSDHETCGFGRLDDISWGHIASDASHDSDEIGVVAVVSLDDIGVSIT